MKKILVFTTSIGLGGITSYMINLVNDLSNYYDITLAYTTDDVNKLKNISHNVRKISFKYPSQIDTLFQIVKNKWLYYVIQLKLRNHKDVSPMCAIQRISYAQAQRTNLCEILLEHYDVAISTAEFYCNDVVALKVNADKKIAWIHPDYRALNVDLMFDRKVLDCFDWIAVVSENNKKNISEIIPDYKNKVIYVPNLLNTEFIKESAKVKPIEYERVNTEHIIVTVCRLDNSSKRLDRAVRICRALKDRGESFQWFIIGDGPDREMIQTEITRFDVEDKMIMLGSRSNPYPYLAYADVFVLTSQYEGRPITVDEAIVLNCPVIVTEYGAAKEQVKPEYGTVIVNSDDIIADEVCKCMDWRKINQQHIYMKENNVLSYIHDIYIESMNTMLK